MRLFGNRMRCKEHRSGTSNTPLKCAACLFAFVLICCSLLSIFWKIPAVYASTELQQANSNTASKLLPLDATQTSTPTPTQTSTSTPIPTTTNTPTPTQTSTPAPTPTRSITPSPTKTTAPGPSPTVNGALTPTPTFTSLATPAAGAQQNGGTTNVQTPSPGATPASSATSIISIPAQSTDNGQTPVSSLATTSNSVDQSSQRAQQSGSNFPYSPFMIGFGSLVLLGLLFSFGWVILRRRLVALPSSKYPPSGAAPWSRIRNFE